ncbi:MAG: protein kinase [Planctomycetes bacterium]|nr:protein kinase [Planctomycetota bacterium]
MGTVFRATDLELGRKVAVKVLHAGSEPDGERVQRFQREAATAARLRHPNLVTIFEVGRQEDLHFFAMEYVEGATLAHLIHQKRLKLDEGLGLLLQVAEGIEYAHKHGVIHRDLKPQNILVDRDGRAFVADFGLAKDLESQSRLTRTGGLLGTPMYMAPEQADGTSGGTDVATDVYGLGAVLYELLAGRPPFEGSTSAEIMYAVLFRDPLPPTRVNRRVPQDLETVCLHALEKEKRRRYASAQAFANDLRRFQQGEPIQARPVGTVGRTLRKVRRHRAAFAAGATGLVVAGGAIAFALAHTRNAAEGLREREQKTAEGEARVETERAELKAGRHAREEASELLRRAGLEQPAERALELCSAAVAADPGWVEALARRAALFTKLHRTQEAIDDYTRALALAPGDLQLLYDRADEYAFGLRDLDHAAADYRAILARDPANILAIEGNGCLALIEGRTSDAVRELTRALEKDPTRWSPYYFRGTAYLAANALTAAITDLTAALARKPPDPANILVTRAQAENYLLEPNRSLADAEQALLLHPRFPRALMEKALALKLLGRKADALRAAEDAIAQEPRNAEFFARLAQVHSQFGDGAAAFEAATRALDIHPRCVMALQVRAALYLGRGDARAALADADAVLAMSDAWSGAHALKAQALLATGDAAGALREASRAAELDPDDPNHYDIRGQCHAALGDAAGAARDHQKYIELLSARNVDSAPFHLVIARALAADGRLEEAVARATQAIRVAPDSASGYRDRAIFLIKLGRHDQALRDAEKAVSLSPDDYEGHRLRGIACFILGRPADAVRALEEAVKLNGGGNSELWNNLAHGYNLLGNTPKAVEALERGLALNPTAGTLLYNLACLQGKTQSVEKAVGSLARAIESGWQDFPVLAKDPDIVPLAAHASYGRTVAEACLRRAAQALEAARAVAAYAPAQARVENERAIEVLGFALTLTDRIPSRSTLARVHALRATAYAALADRERQIAELESAAGLDPTYAGPLALARGDRDLDEGRPLDAEKAYSAALAAQPDLAEAWCGRGKARLEQGDRAGALADLEAGFAKSPDLRSRFQAEWQRARVER